MESAAIGTLRIDRTSAYRDRLRSYEIVLDGQTVAQVRDGGSVDLQVPAGRHSIRARISCSVDEPRHTE